MTDEDELFIFDETKTKNKIGNEKKKNGKENLKKGKKDINKNSRNNDSRNDDEEEEQLFGPGPEKRKTSKMEMDEHDTPKNHTKKNKKSEFERPIEGIIQDDIANEYPMFITFSEGAKDFQKLLECLESDFPEINIEFKPSPDGIGIHGIDSPGISLVLMKILATLPIFERYHCEKTFSLTLNTKTFASKFRKPEKFTNVSFVISKNDPNTIMIVMIDADMGTVEVIDIIGNDAGANNEISEKTFHEYKQIEFSAKVLSDAIGRFKDISKLILIACDYKKFFIASAGGTKQHHGPAKKRFCIPLKQEANSEMVKADVQQGIKEFSADSKSQLNDNIKLLLGHAENKNSESVLSLLDTKGKYHANHYVLCYLTSIMKVSDLSTTIHVGFSSSGGLVLKFSLAIGDLTYFLSSPEDE